MCAMQSSQDLKLFLTAMRGVGVHPHAVCSFQPQQLQMDGLCDTVLFFHGVRCMGGEWVGWASG